MPLYEYECDRCGRFEVMQKFSDPALKRCPTCKTTVTKLISNTSFQLKGTGWYATDYARKGTSAKTEASSKSDGTAPAKESKADGNAKETAATGKTKEASAA